MTALLDYALDYAARGWPVFPLCPRGKEPLTAHGFKEATTNTNIIERWWDRWPDANIGVATGETLGAWVLDVDGEEGSGSLNNLEEELGALPDTLEQRTGGGGRHLFFSWPPREIRNKQSIRPGLDVRGEGGYVVVPPSEHESGQKYDWPYGEKTPVAPAPLGWLNFLVPPVRQAPPWERVGPRPPHPPPPAGIQGSIVNRARLYLDECEPAIQGSGGHNALLWAARALVVGFELDDATALDLLWNDFNPRCRPPWDPSRKKDRRDFERKVGEARRTPGTKPAGWLLDELGLRDSTEVLAQIAKGQESAQRLLAQAAAKALALPTPIPLEESAEPIPDVSDRQEFPVAEFPAPIASYCCMISESHGVDLSFAALPVLSVAGAAMGNAWRLELKRGFVVPPILWAGLVSPSGTNKSGPLRDVMAPLRKTIQVDQLAEGLLNPQGQLEAGNITVEAVAALLQESHRGLLVFQDELAGWLASFNQYKKGGGDIQAWVEFWGGGHYLVNRKTNDERTVISAASCCILGGIQPRILMKCFDPELFASGMVPRFLFACPPARTMFWNEAEVSAEAEQAWDDTITWLRTRPFLALDTNRGQFQPRVVELTEEAKIAYVSFFNQMSLQGEEIGDEGCQMFLSKARVTAGRLALIHHGLRLACERTENLAVPLSLASMEAATRWTRWCLDEQIRLYGFGERQWRTDQAALLVGLIASKCPTRSATVRQVQRLNQRRWAKADAARAVMDIVVDLGLATWDERQKKITLLGQGEAK